MTEKCSYCHKGEDQQNLFFPTPCRCKGRIYIHINCYSNYRKKNKNVCFMCKTTYKKLPNEEETRKIETLFLDKLIQKEKSEEEFKKLKDFFWDMITQKYPMVKSIRDYYEGLEKYNENLYQDYVDVVKNYQKFEKEFKTLKEDNTYLKNEARNSRRRERMN